MRPRQNQASQKRSVTKYLKEIIGVVAPIEGLTLTELVKFMRNRVMNS